MDSAEKVAKPKEVVSALLDYLVDPMLPLKVSGKDPPLETQEGVAKQMHAVVLLYNYYHREQNPLLDFLEFGAFCKLAVSIKPPLIAHMKYTRQTDKSGSDDMESQLSVTEKAIKDACKISLALTALRDVSNTEGWPVSKVSVLLIDSKKENCLLQFGAITNGVWSVIEKCLNISDLPPEGSSKGKNPNKKKCKGGEVLTGEQSYEELAFQQIAFSAVEEATGIKQSGLTVLERHFVYSLSEERMAAYFYIMQCTQSSHEDIQIPIEDVIESLQGSLLKRTSSGWIVTPKIEYYDVLPYARIMSGSLSRKGVPACSETLNLSSSWRTEKDFEKEAAKIEEVNPNGLHNLIVELENVNTNSSEGPDMPMDGQVKDKRGNINGTHAHANSYGEEPTGAGSSNMKEEVDGKEKPYKCADEKPSDGQLTGEDCSNRTREVDDKIKPDKCTPEELTGANNSNRKEEVHDNEKPDKCASEDPSDGEVQHNMGSVYGNCSGANSCSKESTAAESCKRKEQVENKEKPDKYCPEKPSEGEPTGADSSNRKEVADKEKPDKCDPEKPCGREVQDNRYRKCTDANSYFPEKPSEGELTGDSSNRKVEAADKEKPDKCLPEKSNPAEVQDNRYCTDADSYGKEPTGAKISDRKVEVDKKERPKYSHEKPSDRTRADSDNREKQEVDDKGKPDKCALEKSSEREVQNNKESICGSSTGANSCGKEPTGADSFNRKGEVDHKVKPDECCDTTKANTISFSNAGEGALKMTSTEQLHITLNFSSTQQKMDVDDSNTISFGNTDAGALKMTSAEELQIDVDNSNTISLSNADGGALKITSGEKLQINPNFSSKQQKMGVDNSDTIDLSNADAGALKMTSPEELQINPRVFSKQQKMDIDSSNTKSFSNVDAGAPKMVSAEELQISPNSSKRQKMDVDGIATPWPKRGGKTRNYSMPIRVYHHQKRKISVESVAGSSIAVTGCNMETSEAMKSNGNALTYGKVAGIYIQGPISSSLNEIPAADFALVPYEPDANDIGKLQTVLARKETEISEAALRGLLRKREEMCHQQRILEDEIALCSRDIRKVTEGEENALALKLEAMIDYCNDTFIKGKTQIEGEIRRDDVQRKGQSSKRNRVSKAILTFQSPCQELDYKCHGNNWRLPIYLVSGLSGGFIAKVTMKEMDFEFVCEGELLSTPEAARNSAAALMIAKLREFSSC